MARQPRLFVSGGVYHVYCRTHRGERRFDSKVEADTFVETAAEVAALQHMTILGFALMSNHYHLVVRTGDIQLRKPMAAIHSKVTREYNRRHRVFGTGWQTRYRERCQGCACCA